MILEVNINVFSSIFLLLCVSSYVQYYKPLVDRLVKFDLVLKGLLEDAELLIFPSNLLPPGSQCKLCFTNRKIEIFEEMLGACSGHLHSSLNDNTCFYNGLLSLTLDAKHIQFLYFCHPYP